MQVPSTARTYSLYGYRPLDTRLWWQWVSRWSGWWWFMLSECWQYGSHVWQDENRHNRRPSPALRRRPIVFSTRRTCAGGPRTVRTVLSSSSDRRARWRTDRQPSTFASGCSAASRGRRNLRRHSTGRHPPAGAAISKSHHLQRRTRPPGCLALARWAGWSGGQVGSHVKWWRREWNGGGGPLQGPLARKQGLSSDKLCMQVPKFLVTPLLMGPVCLLSQGWFEEPVRHWSSVQGGPKSQPPPKYHLIVF